MPLPTLLCIGAQKAGTTWLFEQLQHHPGVWMPPVKELHFFDHLYIEANRSWTSQHIRKPVQKLLAKHLHDPATVDWSYVSYLADLAAKDLFTEDWYRRAFDRPRARDRVACDITPAYCAIGPEGVDHVARLLPGVRILYIVRDPVQRALSQLRMNVDRAHRLRPSEAQMLEMARDPAIANRGDYLSNIPRWLARFERSRLLFVPFGDIRDDPAGAMRTIEDFSGLKRFSGYRFADPVHPTRKIEIPDSVVQYFAATLAPQYEFLRTHFGEEFVGRSR